MKKILIVLSFFLAFSFASAQEFDGYLVNDDAVTTSNDTLISSWTDISGFGQVELFITIGDSISFGAFTVEWDGGTGTAKTVSVLSGADTLSSLGSASSKSNGVLLRGYTTNIIPGAGSIRITAIRKTYSTAVTSSLKIILRRRR